MALRVLLKLQDFGSRSQGASIDISSKSDWLEMQKRSNAGSSEERRTGERPAGTHIKYEAPQASVFPTNLSACISSKGLWNKLIVG